MSLTRKTLLLGAVLSSSAYAQDYPYDDEPSGEAPLPPEGPTETPTPAPALPTEGPGRASPKRTRQPSLFRVALKAGANFAVLSSAAAGSHSGMGIEGVVAMGWDLAYQPIFLELEFGYRSHFMGDDPLHIVPIRFGTFYRKRMARTRLWKPGVAVSFDARMEASANGSGSDLNFLPALHLSNQFEFGNFLAEPVVSLYRLGSTGNSIAAAFRLGYRY